MEDIQKLKALYKFIKLYYQEKKDFPSFSIIAEELVLKRYEIIELLRILETKNLIIRKGSHYYLPYKERQIEEIDTSKQKLKFNYSKTAIIVFKVFCFFIGLITSYISVLYSYTWFRNYLQFFNSLIFSISIVGFLIISFELIIFFVNNKKYFIGLIFVFLWIIATIFSMSSTLAGQQRQFLINEIRNNDLDNTNNVLILQEIEKSIVDIKIDIEAKRIEREKLLDFLSKIDNFSEDKTEYNDVNYRIYLKNNSIDKLKQELSILENKKISFLESGIDIEKSKKEFNFFKWLENIFKIKDYVFQFVLYLFPAIFVDLISPISFSIVFFLKNNT